MRQFTTALRTFARVINRGAWLGTVFLSLITSPYLCADTTFDDGGVHAIATNVPGPVYVSKGPSGATTLNVLSGGIIAGGA